MDEFDVSRKAVLEIVMLLRTLKRQIALLRCLQMPESEKKKLLAAISSVEEEFDLFKL